MRTPDSARATAVGEATRALTDMGESVENLGSLLAVYGDAVHMAAHLRGWWERDGCPVYAVGSKGQLAPHPALKAIRDAESQVEALARSLNLTPEARSRRRVGAPMGSSTAKDRRQPTRLRPVR